MAVTLIQSDLQFILDQILVSEAHAEGAELGDLLPNAFVPWGLRTVDGSYNNLLLLGSSFSARPTNPSRPSWTRPSATWPMRLMPPLSIRSRASFRI
jgi:hypothetical protein